MEEIYLGYYLSLRFDKRFVTMPNNLTNVLLCPICKALLLKSSEKNFGCAANHNFDLAKEGYLNLLPVQKKNSKNPGDNKEMIAARRSFLEMGYYNPLVKKIAEIINAENDNSEQKIILDAGCGEGYYSAKILERITGDKTALGFDISKYAVKLAAKKYPANFYFVGSVYDMPIKENSIDIIVSVFAPVSMPEFYKILKNKGQLIVVSAGPEHLKEIAGLVYETFKPHPFNLPHKLNGLFEIVETQELIFNILLNNKKDLLSLLKMTPYYWSASKERQNAFEELEQLNVTCDFKISVLNKIGIW
ncbi:MAG: methyltransferase domain-containing protein [Saprospiraceae bacterium]